MITQLEEKRHSTFENIMKISNLNPVFVYENLQINEVVDIMVKSEHRSLPVIDKSKKLAGIVTITDVLDAFLRYENFNEPISRIMTRDIITSRTTDSIEFVIQKMKISRKGRIPIIDSEGKLVGIVSERDVIKNIHYENSQGSIEKMIVRKPLFVSQNLPIISCVRMMVNTKYRRFPVVEQGKLVGMITAHDLVKDLQKINYRHNFLGGEVRDLMSKEIVSVKPEDNISVAIGKILEGRVGMLPVIGINGNLFGIVTERNILEELS